MQRSMGALMVALALACLPAAAQALPPAQPDPGAWVPNYPVSAVVHHGSTTYLGGFFDWVGPWTGAGASVSVPGGTPNSHFPIVAGGTIFASAPDGSGGVFIGGSFTSVGGHPIAHLAHIYADGSIDTVLPQPDGRVNTLAFVPESGTFATDRLYVGGEFGHIGGIQRDGLAEVDLTIFGDGISDSFAPCTDYATNDFSGDQPYAFALAVSSTTVYVGGDFDYASGGAANPTTHAPTCSNQQNTGDVFAVDRSTGNVSTTFLPNPQGEVDALALSPDGSELYFGGQFDYIGNGSSGIAKLARASTSTGALDTSWNPKVGGDVRALQISGNHIYAGGNFTQAGANQLARTGVAELDASTANALPFDPVLTTSPERVNPDVRTLALDNASSPSRVAIGGYFGTAAGIDEFMLADATSGAIDTGFQPRPGGLVMASTFTSPSSVFLGGYFISVGAVVRHGIVALDGYGHPLPVAFNGAGQERQLAVSPDGSTIYATGDSGTGAWSTSTGAKLPWSAPCCVAAIAVAPDDSVVYLGGGFSTVGGAPHVRLAAVNPTTGAPTSWRPDPDGVIYAIGLSPDGKTVYAGGQFQHIGTSVAARANLAAVSATTGDVTAWSPNPNGQIDSIAVTSDGNYVFAGGSFGSIGASPQVRNNLAELTASTGNPTPFGQSYSPNGSVESIAPSDNNSVVFIGGTFGQISYQAAPEIAALDGGSGAPLNWTPLFGHIESGGSIAADGDTVWTGNWGTPLGPDLRPYYAQFSTTPAPAGAPAISPSPVAGRSVTCNSGGWNNAPATLSVVWRLDGAAISGATGRTYTPAAGQVGHKLSCTETAANPAGAASATSAQATITAAPSGKLMLAVSAKPVRFHRTKGTRLTIRLSSAATVTLKLSRLLPGHRTKHGCSTRAKHGRKCTVSKPAGSISWRLRAGTTTVKLLKLGGHALKPGQYLATFTAVSGSAQAAPVKLRLTVLR